MTERAPDLIDELAAAGLLHPHGRVVERHGGRTWLHSLHSDYDPHDELPDRETCRANARAAMRPMFRSMLRRRTK